MVQGFRKDSTKKQLVILNNGARNSQNLNRSENDKKK